MVQTEKTPLLLRKVEVNKQTDTRSSIPTRYHINKSSYKFNSGELLVLFGIENRVNRLIATYDNLKFIKAEDLILEMKMKKSRKVEDVLNENSIFFSLVLDNVATCFCCCYTDYTIRIHLDSLMASLFAAKCNNQIPLHSSPIDIKKVRFTT